MKRSKYLMIPRSVNSKRKDATQQKQQAGKCQNARSENGQSKTDPATPTRNIVKDLLTEMLERSSMTEKMSLKEQNINVVPTTVSDAIKSQHNAPYVNVGAVSYNKRVPVYHRSRKTNQNQSEAGHKVYTGLTWEPEVFVHQGAKHQSARRSHREYGK